MLRLMLIVAAVLSAAPAFAPQAWAQTRTADETAIRKLVADYVGTREMKDQAAVGALFTEDADQQTTTGDWRRGRAGIMAGTLQSTERNPGQRRITVQSIRFLTADAAIIDGPYEITAPDGAVRKMWASLVAVRDGGRWRIGAIRNSIPAAR